MSIGLLLCDDMLFISRIMGTARDLNFTIKPARSAEALYAFAQEETPCCVIVDLGNPGLSIVELLQELRVLCSPIPRVVAYGSHVDTATLHAARAAGCDLVLPRSKFVEELPYALPGWMAEHEVERNTDPDGDGRV
jgi:DNA-binding NarL/FixJ family response regulator